MPNETYIYKKKNFSRDPLTLSQTRAKTKYRSLATYMPNETYFYNQTKLFKRPTDYLSYKSYDNILVSFDLYVKWDLCIFKETCSRDLLILFHTRAVINMSRYSIMSLLNVYLDSNRSLLLIHMGLICWLVCLFC